MKEKMKSILEKTTNLGLSKKKKAALIKDSLQYYLVFLPVIKRSNELRFVIASTDNN